ncbi:hypothetical protein JW978_03370 [Candidatus Dojkabacteria bacterium]|nr:hypothetical protein [Candidatus Dojkabacteria bacterium]
MVLSTSDLETGHTDETLVGLQPRYIPTDPGTILKVTYQYIPAVISTLTLSYVRRDNDWYEIDLTNENVVKVSTHLVSDNDPNVPLVVDEGRVDTDYVPVFFQVFKPQPDSDMPFPDPRVDGLPGGQRANPVEC